MMGDPIQWLGLGVRECALFALVGYLLGGLDDLLVDLLWLARSAWRNLVVYRRHPRATAATLAPPAEPGRLALFVPAWREEAVIGALVSGALARLRHSDWRLYVGCYPNDPGTIAAVERAAGGDPHVRIVIGDRPGGTTKAGCLNWCWQALLADEAAEGVRAKAIILHDAEDRIHRDELRLYDSLVERFDMVQIPVHAEPVRGRGPWAALVSGHYSGEFSEAHAKQVVVREAIGAAVPSAGVGCAIRRDMLARFAIGRDGPFDPASLTEDYEIGLRLAEQGGKAAFVRLPAADGRGLVAVHACFPHDMGAAAKQKARWTTGIALAGWDRLGWRGGVAERWMRLRDRRAPLAALVLCAGYGALLAWPVAALLGYAVGHPAPALVLPGWIVTFNLAVLGWRIVLRTILVTRSHGPVVAIWTPLHMLIGNFVAIRATAKAIGLYGEMLVLGRVRWDKTEHVVPGEASG